MGKADQKYEIYDNNYLRKVCSSNISSILLTKNLCRRQIFVFLAIPGVKIRMSLFRNVQKLISLTVY